MKLISLIIPFFILTINCRAQNLVRKAALGFTPVELDSASIANYTNDLTQGILIKNPVEGGTLAKLGARDQDLLLEINGKVISNLQDLTSVRSSLRENDHVSVKVLRKGQELTLNGLAVAIPYEKYTGSNVIYDEFSFKDGWIRSIITRPQKNGKFPVIFFIPGYTCSSIDQMAPIHPYRKLIDSLVALEYVVYRIEKPGMGDNLKTGDCRKLGFDQELEAYLEGYRHLLEYDFVDTDNIFLWGHSMGGIYAPLIARQMQPKGVIVYGIIHDTWIEYLLRMVRYQNPRLRVADYVETDQDIRILYAMLYEHYIEGKSSIELSKNPEYMEILVRDFWFDGKDQILLRHEDYWRELYQYNLSEAWANTVSFVLSMNGEADLEVINGFSQREIVQIVNHYHPGNGEFYYLPETDHSMIKVGTLEEGALIRSQPKYRELLDQKFNYEIINRTHNWIQDKLAKIIEADAIDP